jgi:hypothetical protein
MVGRGNPENLFRISRVGDDLPFSSDRGFGVSELQVPAAAEDQDRPALPPDRLTA